MSNLSLSEKKILVTAGPTREAIDPVRFISNHSSGKMGYALATAFLAAGAEVVLVSGPVCLRLQHERLHTIHITTAAEMYLACCRHFETADIAVFAAAVADYRPAVVHTEKIKKQDDFFTIKMIKNVDIACEFGKIKMPHQFSLGFALETNDEFAHAVGKLHRKNFDMVVLNSTNDAGAGFGHDSNKISIIEKDLRRQSYALKSKTAVAEDIVAAVSLSIAQNEEEELAAVADYENMYR